MMPVKELSDFMNKYDKTTQTIDRDEWCTDDDERLEWQGMVQSVFLHMF